MTQFDKLFCNQYTDIGAEWHNVQMCRFWYNQVRGAATGVGKKHSHSYIPMA